MSLPQAFNSSNRPQAFIHFKQLTPIRSFSLSNWPHSRIQFKQ